MAVFVSLLLRYCVMISYIESSLLDSNTYPTTPYPLVFFSNNLLKEIFSSFVACMMYFVLIIAKVYVTSGCTVCLIVVIKITSPLNEYS